MGPRTLAAALLTGLAVAGCCGTNPCAPNPCASNPCDANPCGAAAESRLPAPAAGTAWRVVGAEGALRAGGVVPPGGPPVLTIDADGRTIRAHIPASPATPSAGSQRAGAALAPGAFGSLELRNAP